MFLRIIFCCHQYIIHIDDNFSRGDDVSKLRVHHSLKNCRRITQSEWHYCWFEQSHVVLKVALFSSPSLKRMLLYPARTSIFVKSRASRTLSTSSWIRGRGYQSGTVNEFSFL